MSQAHQKRKPTRIQKPNPYSKSINFNNVLCSISAVFQNLSGKFVCLSALPSFCLLYLPIPLSLSPLFSPLSLPLTYLGIANKHEHNLFHSDDAAHCKFCVRSSLMSPTHLFHLSGFLHFRLFSPIDYLAHNVTQLQLTKNMFVRISNLNLAGSSVHRLCRVFTRP